MDNVSLWLISAGLIVAIMMVLELPPRESLSSQVSVESLYGMKKLLFRDPELVIALEASARAEITEPSVTRDLLMCAPSFNRSPVAP